MTAAKAAFIMRSHSAGDFPAAEATGAHIDMPGRTFNDSLDVLDVGLPCAIGAPVGVTNLDAETNTLIAILTLCHKPHLLAKISLTKQLYYNSKMAGQMQDKFLEIMCFWGFSNIFGY